MLSFVLVFGEEIFSVGWANGLAWVGLGCFCGVPPHAPQGSAAPLTPFRWGE